MAKDTKNSKVKKEKKERKTFFKDFKAELKKVTWPTAKQLINKTIAVIAIVIIISLIVFALDFVFDKGYQTITTKAANMIKKDEVTQTVDENNQVIEATENTNATETPETTEETNETTEEVTAE